MCTNIKEEDMIDEGQYENIGRGNKRDNAEIENSKDRPSLSKDNLKDLKSNLLL